MKAVYRAAPPQPPSINCDSCGTRVLVRDSYFDAEGHKICRFCRARLDCDSADAALRLSGLRMRHQTVGVIIAAVAILPAAYVFALGNGVLLAVILTLVVLRLLRSPPRAGVS